MRWVCNTPPPTQFDLSNTVVTLKLDEVIKTGMNVNSYTEGTLVQSLRDLT